jgi:predicted nucleic-acid-binding protein
MSEFVDANIFLRYLTQDDATKARNARILFERAERGEFDLRTSEAIVAEVVFVLSSKALYRRSRYDIARALKALFARSAIELDHQRSVIQALDLYETTRLDFEDCLAISHATRDTDGRIFSYDRGLGRITGVTRLEPQFDDESPDEPD